jgi:glutathione peroxidase
MAAMTELHDIPLRTLTGEPTTLGRYAGRAVLVVNVASRCGMTPQYAGLQKLYDTYADRGFAVLGFPCNQFGGQEPGTDQQIGEFCSATYGVTFPMFAKTEVNGPDRHPLFAALSKIPDAGGKAGVLRWNFEKFLVSPAGEPVGRFRTQVDPGDPGLVGAVEDTLPVAP